MHFLNFLNKKTIAHLCVLNRNIGDNALNLAIQNELKKRFKIKYINILNNVFNEKTLNKIQKTNLIILGGGGLIHSYGPSGNAIELTGTLWQISLEKLKELKPKIILFGVGFNHFYGEDKPLDIVKDFFEILIEKNSIISFRNDGSKERFIAYFPEFEDFIDVIPDPGIFYRIKNDEQKQYAVMQIAADRLHFRYSNNFKKFIELLRTLCEKIDIPIILIPHTPDDVKFYKSLEGTLNVTFYPLKNKVKETDKVVKIYSGANYTISTRGHSQIISVGNSVPTFSIITHPKVEGFAKTCDIMKYTTNIKEDDNVQSLKSFDKFLNDLDIIREHYSILNKKFDEEYLNFINRVVNCVN